MKVKAVLVFGFDLLLLILFVIWLGGGIPYEGRLLLKHGADPRRAAIILAGVGFLVSSRLRKESRFLQGVQKLGRALEIPKFRWGFYFSFVIFTLFLGTLQTLALQVTLYDVGIFHQVLWSINHGLGFFSTISKAGNFLTDHFCPSVGLLSPLFRLFGETPFFLPWMQVLLLWGGGAAWIYLAENIPDTPVEFRKKLAAATTVFILGFDSLWGNIRWGFHENAIGFFTWSWAFVLLLSQDPENTKKHSRKTALAFALLLLTAGSKEILLADMSLMFAVWAFLRRKKGEVLKSLLLLLFSGGLLAGFVAFEKMSHPADKNYFDRYYSYLGQNLSDFSSSLFHAPQLIVQNVGLVELYRYFWTVFSPWLFLPWLAIFVQVPNWTQKAKWKGNISFWMIAIAPSLASAALSTFPALRRPNFHYVLEIWPILAGITIVILARIRSVKWAWAWAILALLRMDHDPIGDLRSYWKGSQENKEVRLFLKSIPPDVSVSASDLAGTWIASRPYVSRWPDRSLIPKLCPQYIILNMKDPAPEFQTYLESVLKQCAFQTDASFPFWKEGNWKAFVK